MLIFNTVFRLLKRLKGVIIVYGVIFLTLALAMTKVLSSNGASQFSESSMDLAVIDRSEGGFGKAVREYFGSTNEMIEVEDDEKTIQDMLYWRELDYVLIIPEGFEESMDENGQFTMDLQCMEVPGNFESSFFKAELEMYLNKISGLLASGMCLEDATEELEKIKSEQVSVEIASFVNDKQGDVLSNFFSYAPYLFLSLGIVVISSVLIFFNETEVKKRMECSSMPLLKRQASLLGAIVVFGFLLLGIVIVMAGILSKGEMLSDARMPYFLLNLSSMLLFSVSLAFLAGTMFSKTESVNGFVNIVSLALCFLGGIFVPQEFFSEGVQKAARFMPTYWYVKSNASISAMSAATEAFQKEILLQSLLILSTAVAVFAISITLTAIRRKKIA